MRNVNTLVSVAGHATYLDSVRHVPDAYADERLWYLQEFQRGEVPFYVGHMQRGTELVAADSSALGLMSGGRTRAAGGHWGEGSTYLAIARHLNFWQDPTDTGRVADIRSRFGVEGYARDSFENLWFSVMEFHRRVGSFPLRVVGVGWPQKEERFRLHARTLGIPDEGFTYQGVEDPPGKEDFARGEGNALRQWREDPLGQRSPLFEKRESRDPFGLGNPYGGLADYAELAYHAGWIPSRELLIAAALEGSAAA